MFFHERENRDIPYSIDITGKKSTENESPFKDITIETEGLYHYITANYGSTSLRDRIGEIDQARLENREITLTDLAYKHFAYILD